jgi:hypothetical protein
MEVGSVATMTQIMNSRLSGDLEDNIYTVIYFLRSSQKSKPIVSM